jgi:hypothetical protein
MSKFVRSRAAAGPADRMSEEMSNLIDRPRGRWLRGARSHGGKP